MHPWELFQKDKLFRKYDYVPEERTIVGIRSLQESEDNLLS